MQRWNAESLRNAVSSGTRVLLAPTRPSVRQIIAWWEIRRIAYNVILVPTGFLGLLFLLVVMELSPRDDLGLQNDFVPFLSGLGAFIVANILYTLGWIVNVAGWLIWGQRVCRLGPVLWFIGTVASVFGLFVPGFLEWTIW